MKKITQILAYTLIGCMTFLATSCQQECDCSNHKASTVAGAGTRAVEGSEASSFRDQLVGSMASQLGSVASVSRFSFQESMIPEGVEPQKMDLLSEEIIAAKSEASANVEATELVTSIFNTLLAAESTVNQLDVEFSMSDAPVENGSFIFGIESERNQDLTMMMYDEEGFSMVANNQFEITEGSNYKALNVQSLEPGAYIFKLRNEKDGRELIRRVEIAE